jgi:outer membrane biosynthesis protein TonB
MYALIGSVGLLVVAAVIVVVVLLKGNDNKPPVQLAAATAPDKVESSADKAPDPGAGSVPAVPKASDPAANSAAGSSQPGIKPPDPRPADGSAAHVAPSDPPEPKHPPVVVHKPPTPSNTAPTQPKPPKPAAEKPPTPVAKPDPQTKDGGSCDEVSCVLNNYEGACCAKFKRGGGKAPSGGTATPSGAKSDLPESLDRAMISDGVAKVKARVMSCGDKSPAKGQVKVSVKVSPDGHVSGVTVKNTPDVGLGNCVAGQMQKATFGKTQSGGSFSYPYTF